MAKHPKSTSISCEKNSPVMPISEQEKQRRMRAVQGADAINAIEGAPISDYARQLSARWANGKITHEEMVEALVKRHTCLAERA